ncbi:MAG: MFS transporter [Actinobacteria bacterium]|nr:MFS transporter [Actinomycetota bacterium]
MTSAQQVRAEAAASQEVAQSGRAGRLPGSLSAWLLAVCCVAQFMVILDLSIVNVALPSIQSSLNFSAADLQWIVNAYAITFAGFLMLGGRAADYFGQRRTFVAALVLFAAASLAGGLAPDKHTLIIARGVQGVAGALMAASSLAIITSSFPAGPARHRAIGLWGAMNGVGGAAGVLLGGILTEALSWRWILLINPPIAIAAALVAFAVVTNRRRERGRTSFDLPGALTLTVGQMVLVYGIVTAGLEGWGSTGAVIPIAVGAGMLALFGVIEARLASAPLIPFRQLTKSLQVTNTIVVLFSAALFPMWYVTSLYLQQVLGLSPLDAGLVFLPMALTIMVGARRAGALVNKFGVRLVLGSGLVLMTAGMLLFARIASNGSATVYAILPGVLTAAGIGLAVVASTIGAVQGAREGQAGLASGLVNTSRQVGGGLGIALLITLATQYTTHLIGDNRSVTEALTEGFRLAYLIGAGLVAAAAVMTFTLLRAPAAEGSTRRQRGGVALGVVALVAVFVAIDFTVPGGDSPIGAYTTKGAMSFVSAPSLHPPELRDGGATAAGKLAPGYMLTANFYHVTRPPIVGQSGPLILDNDLQPVWFKPAPEDVVASNLSLQTYQGKPALSWWEGVVTNAGTTESGEYVVVDQHYKTVARLKGRDNWILTLHALVIDGDHAWVTANRNLPRDLSKYGGTYNGTLVDSAVQEYDLKTGKLLRTWNALDHISLDDSHSIPPTNGFPWDAYHVNWITLTGDGKFLVSMRDTWAAYLVDIDTGQIEWTLGGKHSSFAFGPRAEFQWQHDVALEPGSLVTLFDDHCCLARGADTWVDATEPSRALVLRLDQQARRATFVAEYGSDRRLAAAYMGNAQPLENGNVLVGWGSQPYFSEYSKSGDLLMDAVFPSPNIAYRVNRAQWIGLPLSTPSGAARVEDGRTTVYASWNGATRVASWRVMAGPSADRMAIVTTKAKSGFETAVTVPNGSKSFEVQALDAGGRVIGSSRPFSLTA